jgi:outer membrane lipoprotein SlyB
MAGRNHFVALAVVFALTGVTVTMAAQQRPNRVSDQQVTDLLSRIDTGIAAFRSNFDQAIDRNRINGSRAEDDINQTVNDFKQATDRLRDRVQNRRADVTDVEDVMRRASMIDAFMTSHALGAAVDHDWQSLRGDLDELARAYGVTRNWNDSRNAVSRVDDQQVGQLLIRTKKNADRFRHSLDRALSGSRIDGLREDDNIHQFVIDFAETTNHLSDHFDRRQVVTNDIEDVLRRGVRIDSFMQRHQLAVQAENDWLTVRRDLDELSRAYNVAWNWSDPRYTADERAPGLYHRLTGTYQLESERGDDPRQAVEEATRTLSANQRQRTSQRLMNRLNAPETIAIDRNENSVTMASSRGPRVTFEADGQVRTEQGYAGRTVNTRAILYGDQLVVTTTGHGGHDFAVTFEPIDSGRNLRVTRRISDDNLRQPVTVRSFYRKSSDEAQWDVYFATQGAPSQTDSSAGDFAVPDGTRLVATLDNALSTRNAHAEDRFTITTLTPSQYEGAVIEGTVSSVNPSGRLSGRADMALNFESIRMRNGRTYQFAGVIENVRTANGETISVDNDGTVEENSQTEKTVQRGAIGAAVGAIIGAIAGGGKGAAIGAAIGAGGGAGTVIVQGRDQLDLPRGTELTITSDLPGSQRTSTSGQR